MTADALDRLQIQEEGKMKANMDYFLHLLDERIAERDLEKRRTDAEILQLTSEHFLHLQGKKVEKQSKLMVDETGRKIDTDTFELLRIREKQVRLRYCDNYFTRYIYYNTSNWCERFGKMLGISK